MKAKEIRVFKSKAFDIKIREEVTGNTTHTQILWGDFIQETVGDEELRELSSLLIDYLFYRKGDEKSGKNTKNN